MRRIIIELISLSSSYIFCWIDKAKGAFHHIPTSGVAHITDHTCFCLLEKFSWREVKHNGEGEGILSMTRIFRGRMIDFKMCNLLKSFPSTVHLLTTSSWDEWIWQWLVSRYFENIIGEFIYDHVTIRGVNWTPSWMIAKMGAFVKFNLVFPSLSSS